MPAALSRHSLLLAIFASAIFLVFAYVYQWPAYFEDSFITYRYIDALNRTGGFNWNYDGNAVYGMTGLIFPLISAAASLVFGDPIISASIIGTIAAILALFILSANVKASLLSSAVVILVAANPIFLRGASNGLETSLAFLFVVSIYLIKRLSRRWWVAAFVTFLGFYIRPDIILIAYVLFSMRYGVAARWQTLFLYNVSLGVLLLAGLISAYVYFGDALPLPSALKLTGIGLVEFPRWILSQYVVFPIIVSSSLLVPVTILLARGSWENPRQAIVLLLPLAIFLLYQLTSLPIMNVGYRFAAPILAGLCSSSLIIGHKKVSWPAKYLRVAIAASVVFVSLVTPAQIAQSKRSSQGHSDFASLGSVVSSVSDLHIASSEAGKFSYYSIPNRFFDTIGLNSEFVARNSSKSNYFDLLKIYFVANEGFPDLYVMPLRGAAAGKYAFLENLDGFEDLYSCQEERLKICILNESPRKLMLQSKIEAWKAKQ
jgi:hypothetical protein